MACGVKVVTGSKDGGRDRCEHCKVSVRIGHAEVMVDVGVVKKDGTLIARLQAPANVTAVRLESVRAQHSWLIVRAVEVLPCEEDRRVDSGELWEQNLEDTKMYRTYNNYSIKKLYTQYVS